MNTAAALSLHAVLVIPWTQHIFKHRQASFWFRFFNSLTELGAPHEVGARWFGVSAVHLSGLGVELGKHASVEAVVVLHEAEGRRAVGHGLELFLLYSLGSDVVVVDVVSFRKQHMLLGV